MGRRKIEIQPLTDDRNRTVTFVKRKAGLFKKAHELAVLCQVDLAIIIVGNNKKLYEFSSVDTNELIKVYQGTKPHELKSPENYGNYKKKKHISSNLRINDDLIDEELDDASDYESESPEPKRGKRNYNSMTEDSKNPITRIKKRPLPPNHISLTSVPTFNSFRKVIQEDDKDESRHFRNDSVKSKLNSTNHSRPVLRVQIPTDSKSGIDSARTITAMDTVPNPSLGSMNQPDNESNITSSENIQNTNGDNTSGSDSKDMSNGPIINTSKYSNFGTFRSPDTKKPITQLPLPIPKSQTSSPSSATAPPLPSNGMTTFFNPLSQQSPSSQYPHSSVPTPILSQIFNDAKFRNGGVNNGGSNGPAATANSGGSGTNTGPGNASGNHDPPMSGLPSRYVNDIFPSPSNFYVSQDWSSGITPYHNNLPQYFMNMMPNQSGRQSSHQTPTHQAPAHNPSQSSTQPQSASQSQPTTNSELMPHTYPFPSPIQFMGQSFNNDKK